jgi:O-antigen/teichoic acid export membrane protein
MTTNQGMYSSQRTKSNAWKFLFGKGFSALCTIGLLGSIVRFLPLAEYALYVSFLAALETSIVLSSLGLDWMIIRYVPQYAINGSYSDLRKFLVASVIVRLMTLLVFSGLASITLFYFWPLYFFERSTASILLVSLFVSEGLLRLLRDNTLESLANQSLTQVCVVLRQGVFLLILLVLPVLGMRGTLEITLACELAASSLALMAAIYSVRRAITPLKKRIQQENWKAPIFFELRRTALHNYIGGLISYPYSLQSLVLLVVAMEGAASAALFGFVVRLVEILRGYLPALLLMNVLRPRIFGLYELTKGFEKPAAEARVISRISLLTIFPVLIVFSLYGDWIIETASGGRFHDGGILLLVFALSLVFRVQRQMATLLINCVNCASILVRNAAYSLILFPVFFFLAYHYENPIYVAFAVVSDEILWTFSSGFFLNRAGYKWASDIAVILKISFSSLVGYALLKLFSLQSNINGFLFSLVFTVIFYVTYVYFFNPLGTDGTKVKDFILNRAKEINRV